MHRCTIAVAAAALVVSPLAGVAAPASGAAVTAAAPAAVIAPAGKKATMRKVFALRNQVVATAMSKLDAKYRWGGSGPDKFDCSGLVMWVYQQVTGVALPHYSGAQWELTRRPIPRTELRKGDLLFYGKKGSDHVTIYVGNRMQIGASSPRSGIVVNSIDSDYYVSRYAGAGRVIRLPLSQLPIYQ